MKKIILFFILLWAVNCFAQGKWSNLGNGIPLNNFGVVALCADTVNNVLYAGGEFDSAGTLHQNSLAKWDGSRWDTTVSIDSGRWVYALIMYKGNLIIGFSDGSVEEYNGSTSQYLPGFNEAVLCFYIYNDTLYAGGQFTQSGNTDLNFIAKWSGSEWSPVDRGFSWIDCCADVEALTEYNGDLIAAGTFDSAGNVAATSIAAYDGNNWISLGVKLIDYTTVAYNGALAVYKNKLYVNGNFDSVNSVYSNSGIASWDGTNWDTVLSNTGNFGGGAPANIKMQSFDGYLFVSGEYNNQIPYRYDGNVLSTVDSGVRAGNIYAMTIWNGSLYVGGDFQGTTEVRPYTSFCIARWTPDSTTGIKQVLTNNNQLTISPNPFSQSTTIKLNGNNMQHWQFILQDLLGRTVAQYNNVGEVSLTIPRNNLPAGLYIGIAKDDEGSMLGKIKVVAQ